MVGGDLTIGGFVRGVLCRDDGIAGPPCEASEALFGLSMVLGSARGTNRFWAAGFVTPMLLPMSVQEAPERRA